MRANWHWRMERRLNILSHALGILLAMFFKHQAQLPEVTETFFYGSFMLLFAASCCYHYSEREVEIKAETFFYKCDVSMIAIVIACSCFAHAFTLPQVDWRDSRLTIAALVLLTAVALIIVVLVFLNGKKTSRTVNTLFVLQVAVPTFALPNWNRVFELPMIALFCGVVCYGSGMWFVLHDYRHRYFHFIWHLWVLAGFALHHLALILS